jgi:hypothetical protein
VSNPTRPTRTKRFTVTLSEWLRRFVDRGGGCGGQGDGLSAQQEAICDGFVYIPQYGPGTASLNVTVAASIVLHSFAVWAGYEERARDGVKFVVGPPFEL